MFDSFRLVFVASRTGNKGSRKVAQGVGIMLIMPSLVICFVSGLMLDDVRHEGIREPGNRQTRSGFPNVVKGYVTSYAQGKPPQVQIAPTPTHLDTFGLDVEHGRRGTVGC